MKWVNCWDKLVLTLSLVAVNALVGCASDKADERFSDLPPAPKTVASGPLSGLWKGTGPWVEIDGDVENPGRYQWVVPMTLRDAVAAAGGFTKSATGWVQWKHSGTSTGELYYLWDRDVALRNVSGERKPRNATVQPGDFVSTVRFE